MAKVVAHLASFDRAFDTRDELAREGIRGTIKIVSPPRYDRFEVVVSDRNAERAGKLLARGW